MLWETNGKQSTTTLKLKGNEGERRRECAHDYYQINYLIITEIKVCQLPQQMIKLRVNFL